MKSRFSVDSKWIIFGNLPWGLESHAFWKISQKIIRFGPWHYYLVEQLVKALKVDVCCIGVKFHNGQWHFTMELKKGRMYQFAEISFAFAAPHVWVQSPPSAWSTLLLLATRHFDIGCTRTLRNTPQLHKLSSDLSSDWYHKQCTALHQEVQTTRDSLSSMWLFLSP